VYTEVEKTMIELQRAAVVNDTRSAFQSAMQQRLIASVERLSGRQVTMFMSDHHVGPDIEIELFMLAPQDALGPHAVDRSLSRETPSCRSGALGLDCRPVLRAEE
jgi:uncharacterized protein YbcI